MLRPGFLPQPIVQSVNGLHELSPLVKNLFGFQFASIVSAQAALADLDRFFELRQAVEHRFVGNGFWDTRDF